MRIKFWGTRGSIAQSTPNTLRYGGHTSCVEIRSAANDLLVLDAGTGLQGLSRSLLKESSLPRTSSILISHTHWDHIQGLPFFTPFFVSDHQWDLFGPASLSQDLESILRGQMQQTYFPITPEIFNASMNYHNIIEGSFEIGDIKVTTRYLNHPGVTLGYRIEVDGYTIVYSTDHEPHDCRLAHGGAPVRGSEDDLHGQFLAQADYVIHDTQYLADEYERYRGWGHSTMEYVVDLAHRADVKNLVLFHHDPLRTDSEIDQIIDMGKHRIRGRAGPMEVIGASESVPILLDPNRKIFAARTQPRMGSGLDRQDTSSGLVDRVTLPHSSVLYCTPRSNQLDQVINRLGLTPVEAKRHDDLPRLYREHTPSILFFQVSSFDELKSYYEALPLSSESPPAIIFLCQADECLDRATLLELSPQPIRLVEPVSDIYLSSRIQTWINRLTNTHRSVETWERAPIPNDDFKRAALSSQVIQRLSAEEVHSGSIKHRLQGLLEIAYHMMRIPFQRDIKVALNLITQSAQETLLHHPAMRPISCSRDASICSHVVAREAPLHIIDDSQGSLLNRYNELSSTTEGQEISIYLGVPVRISGSIIGVLCCYGSETSYFHTSHLEGLTRVASLVESALGELSAET